MNPRLLIIHRARWGGAEKTLLDWIEGLTRDGWPLTVAAPEGRFLARVKAWDIPVEPVDFSAWRKPRDYFKNRNHKQRISNLAASTNANLIIAGDFRTAPFAVAAAKNNRIPCLSMVQDGTIQRRHVRAYRLHRADLVVCPSYPLLHRIRHGGVDRERSILLPVGIDTKRFHPASEGSAFREEWKISHDAILIGCVGSISHLKGQDLLLEAASPLLERNPCLQIVFVGTGQEEFANKLKNQYPSYVENGRIRFAGWREDIPSVLAAFDIVVVPSRAESFSRATAEAMSVGKPVIATQTGAVEELIGYNEYGLTVPVDDVSSLREVLRELSDEPGMRKELGKAATARIHNSFSLARSLEILQDVLLGLCGNRKPVIETERQ